MNENKALTTLAICGAAYLAYTYWKRKKAGKTRPEKVIETYRYEEKTVVVEPEPKTFILSQNQIKALQTKLNGEECGCTVCDHAREQKYKNGQNDAQGF